VGGTYLNPANAITASRYFTLPAFLYYVDKGMMQHAVLMIIVCGVMDLFDGPVARKFNCTSGFGEMFDAVTDALCYAFFLIVEVKYGLIPLIPMLMFVGLAVVNAVLRLVYARRVGRTTNYRSWAMERLVAYTAYLAGLALVPFETAFFAWAIPFFMAIIVIHDFKRMVLDPVPS